MCHLDENAERRYFEKHPEKGRFVWWPTNGTKLDAYNRSAADAAAKVRQWNSTLRSVVLAGSIPCRRGSMRSSGSSKHLVPTTGALRSTSTATPGWQGPHGRGVRELLSAPHEHHASRGDDTRPHTTLRAGPSAVAISEPWNGTASTCAKS
jgi:hypothetical protein